MSLDEKDVLHVAKLSALALREEEVPQMKKDLGDILEYVNRLSDVELHGVPPTSHVHGVVNDFREDIRKDSLPLNKVAENAPDFKGGGFRVPKVI